MTGMIKGILFDMDGVLFDTERISTESWLKTAEAMNIDLPISFINSYKGLTIKESRKLYAQRFGSDFDYDEVRAYKNAIVQEEIEKNGLPMKKGLLELLEYAKKNEIRMAVATSTGKVKAESYLQQSQIYDYFQAAVYGDTLEVSKPEPDIYLEAARRIGLRAEDCFVIEDSPMGIQSGYRAGARVIHIPDQIKVLQDVLDKTYAVCADLSEVIDLIKNS